MRFRGVHPPYLATQQTALILPGPIRHSEKINNSNLIKFKKAVPISNALYQSLPIICSRPVKSGTAGRDSLQWKKAFLLNLQARIHVAKLALVLREPYEIKT